MDPTPNRRFWRTWLSVLAMALVIAFGAQPLLTVLLQLAQEGGVIGDQSFMPLWSGGLILVFAAAIWGLARLPEVARRIEVGSRAAAILFGLAIPVMGLMVWQAASAEAGRDHGGAAAAFFMLVIFGGYCAILGGGLFILSEVMRRKRQAP